jgi:hypothetical protein
MINVSFDSDEPPRDLTPESLALQPWEDASPAIELAETWTRPCALCREPLQGRFWWWRGRRWYGATCHDRCLRLWDRNRVRRKAGPLRTIPERFAAFDPAKFRYERALSQAQDFQPGSRVKVLALIGPIGRGKSRLIWQVISQFFDIWEQERGQSRWVDAFNFSDLLTEYDQARVMRIKNAQFVLIDDIGDCPAGRMRSTLQEVIRYRAKTQAWTFLTCDDIAFDPDLVKHVFVERALVVMVGD